MDRDKITLMAKCPPPRPLLDSIVDTIGLTPMVELHRLAKAKGRIGRLLIKLENFNPGSSKKDRIALEMIRLAKKSGDLRDGQTVVELTSGNAGTGFAIVCQALGHPFVAVMSRGNTAERAKMMRALGAEVVLINQAPGSLANQVSGQDLALVEQHVQELVQDRQAFRCDQFKLESNVLAHQRHTGPEIWQQSHGLVDVFLDFVGTGGTFSGVMRHLKQQNPHVRGYVVEPAAVAVLAGQSASSASHKIQGGGYNMADLPHLDRGLVTDYVAVSDDDAIEAARQLALLEGIFAGYSTGAHVAAALQLLAGREQGAVIAFLACDSGMKYFSTDLYV